MSEYPDYIVKWLEEVDRRVHAGEPTDNRSLTAALHDVLPRDFRVADFPSGLRFGVRLSVRGLRVIGDPRKLLPDVDRLIRHIRDALLKDPSIEQIGAGEVAESLGVDQARAQQLLELVVSLGKFASGGMQAERGYVQINLHGDEVFHDFRSYDGLDSALAPAVLPTRPKTRLAPLAPSQIPAADTEDPKAVFVVMSMDPTNPTLTDVVNSIKDTCARFGLVATRVDDHDPDGPITDKILERIRTSRYIIADLTGERPNVYYEVGYAHALGKSPILVRAAGTKLHFDLAVHNVREYANQTQLRTLLQRRFENILGRVPSAPAP